ncbi:unnamed protein product [Soboliphyme baturini]|uniref:Geranylgeranyl transferase type-2 subunit alpha n=1 Tax=Soboliphyme baturini TaxID=241478 RepID=A0A183IW02_9BILA|nr:unnamed protein product [Soboliphyme baturini]
MSGLHGRVKETVNVETAEVERKQKEEKLRRYLQARNVLFEKIRNNVFDEDDGEWQKVPRHVFDAEMSLTEVGLAKNPKSYSAWHHRVWMITVAGVKDDCETELRHCEKALEMDDRNFHCWDYRRFICRFGQRSAAEELAFIDKKVSENFSNYSAWHSRSALLPVVHPPLKTTEDEDGLSNGEETKNLPVDVATFEQELNFVQNAFFTDPEDQSSWFYHNWLFAVSEPRPLNLLQAVFDPATAGICLVFDQAISAETSIVVVSVRRDSNKECLHLHLPWRTSDGTRSCRLLCAPLPDVSLGDLPCLQVEYRQKPSSGKDNRGQTITRKLENWTKHRVLVWTDLTAYRNYMFSSMFASGLKRALEEDLYGCKKLIELEPDNHWAYLTAVNAMIALDPLQFSNDIVGYLNKLVTLDPSRKKMYLHFLSRYLIKFQLVHSLSGGTPDKRLDLSDRDLHSLCDGVWFVHLTVLVVNRNRLCSLQPLKYALHLEELYANDNRLTSLVGLEDLQKLRNVSVANNRLRKPADLRPLVNIRALHVLVVSGNVICEHYNRQDIVKFLPSSDSLIIEL